LQNNCDLVGKGIASEGKYPDNSSYRFCVRTDPVPELPETGRYYLKETAMLNISTLRAAADLSGFSVPDLRAFFNANAAAELPKSAKRPAIESAVLALIAELDEAAKATTGTAVAVVDSAEQNAEENSEEQNDDDAPDESPEEEAARIAAEAHADANPEKAAAARRAAESRTAQSEGVARSWLRPEVRETRLTRNAVEVSFNGNAIGYRSVAEAFRVLGLDFSKHIKFRLSLKTSATKTAIYSENGTDYAFALDTASEE
jgi:hypothetical protein